VGVVYLSGAADGFGAALASGLRARGATVVDLGDVAALCTAAGARDRFATAAGAAGPADAVVHAAVDPITFESIEVGDAGDERMDDVWERPMRACLFVLQAAFAHLAGRGGRVVLVTPTLALSGAAGFGLYAAAAEGQRLLAKSAARQWGSDGITVNCIAPSAATVGVDPGVLGAVTLSPPALGTTGDVAADIAPVVDFLLGPDAHFVTGATIGVDGGAWLTP
jgi:3-oxoacyl-[acyl-carrier protein] reductase